jgi:hypothetical protein
VTLVTEGNQRAFEISLVDPFAGVKPETKNIKSKFANDAFSSMKSSPSVQCYMQKILALH